MGGGLSTVGAGNATGADNTINIRKASMRDLGQMLAIYERARTYMRENGNPNQWGDTYPPKALLEADINAGISYVLEDGSGKVRGTFVFFVGEEPAYRTIRNGSWLDDKPYGVIHRVAGDGQLRGVAACCVRYCFKLCNNLRMDTHRDNLIMQHALEKQGFKRCGIVCLEDGSERIAYHKNAAVG